MIEELASQLADLAKTKGDLKFVNISYHLKPTGGVWIAEVLLSIMHSSSGTTATAAVADLLLKLRELETTQ